MTLHPKLQSFLDGINQGGGKKLEELSLEELRDAAERRSLLAGDRVEVLQVRNHIVENKLSVREYVPSRAENLPVFLYFHPGGFVRGSIETSDPTCRLLCNRLNARIFSVEYRLAPEDPYPAAVDDAKLALQWIINDIEKPERVVIGGESSGANLAAILAHFARDNKIHLAQQILIYPPVDYTLSKSSMEEFKTGYLLTKGVIEFYAKKYLPKDVDPKDPGISQLCSPDCKHRAPALLISAEYDPLRDEVEAYALKLKEHGVPTTMRRFERMIHGFFSMIVLVGDDALRFVADHFLRS